MSTLRSIIDKGEGPLGRAFDVVIQGLILLSLVTFSLETLPDLTPAQAHWLHRVETVTVLVFTAEYLLRLYVARPTTSYAFSFLGLVDLAAILPYYLAGGVDLRSLRAFRLLRIVRILKLARYSAAMQRFHRALIIAREEIVLFLCVTGTLLFLAAVGIYYFEHEAQPKEFASVFHILWWAVATLTTVGYGDVYPITTGGRIFTFFILLVGLGVVSVPAGLVASALGKARAMEDAAAEDETA